MNETPAPKAPTTLCGRTLCLYSLLALPLAFVGLPLYLHAPDFYATESGLSLTVIGLMLFAVRLLDAMQDPFYGYLSDRFAHRRRMLMLAAIGVLVVSFFALFSPPGTMTQCPRSTLFISTWFFVALLLASSAFSFLQINHNALGSLWSKNTFQKTKITASREGMALVGLMIGAALPALLMHVMDKKSAFLAYGGVFVALMLLAGAIFLWWLRRPAACGSALNLAGAVPDAPVGDADAPRMSGLRPCLRETLRPLTTRYRMFFLLYLISALATAIPAVLVVFFIRDVLDAEQYTGLFLGIYFLSGALMLPFWTYVSTMCGKEKAWFIAMMIAALAYSWAFFIKPGAIMPYAFICFFSGAALGAEMALPPSILSDYIDREKETAHSSKNFALLTFCSKFSIALASILTFPLLHFSGYAPGVANKVTALLSASAVYALLPCLLKLLAAGILARRLARAPGPDYSVPSS